MKERPPLNDSDAAIGTWSLMALGLIVGGIVAENVTSPLVPIGLRPQIGFFAAGLGLATGTTEHWFGPRVAALVAMGTFAFAVVAISQELSFLPPLFYAGFAFLSGVGLRLYQRFA